jgi:hypothetical protein
MSNGQFPPGLPPGVPAGALLGAAPPPPTTQIKATILPRDRVQQALYNASATLSQCRAELLNAIAVLTDTHLACKQTINHGKTMDGPVQVGGERMSAQQFAKEFELARAEDADAVAEAIALLKAAVERIPVERVTQLADREPKVIK